MSKVESRVFRLRQILSDLGMNPDPLMVIGMHRSGTTMLVRVLQGAGVFMGSRLSRNLEPRVFQDANRQLFDYFGASWLDPDLLPEPEVLRENFFGLAAGIAERLCEDLAPCFFPDKDKMCAQWGFKDPRSSVTAGLFLQLFPAARAIFIYRKPLDVAASIIAREKKQRRKYPGNEQFEFSESELLSLLVRSIKLWEIYNERALRMLPHFANQAVLRYEDVVHNPGIELAKALSNFGLSIPAEVMAKIDISPAKSGLTLNLPADLSRIETKINNSRVFEKLYGS